MAQIERFSERSNDQVDGLRWRKSVLPASFALLLGVLEYLIFFRDRDHFFQADTIHWFSYRLTSITDFLLGFLGRDESGWYRPLTQPAIQSLFFPSFGLDPAPYRLVLFLPFFLTTIAVFVLVHRISGRRLAAGLATLYFATHTIHAYTTYDIAFVPEVVYSLFYLCSVIAFLRYIEAARKADYWISGVCFIASLVSKESAVTLPFTLAALALLVGAQNAEVRDFGKAIISALHSVRLHGLILLVYLALTLGYLGVGDFAFSALFDRPENLDQGGYHFLLDSTILENTYLAVSWAFNIPFGQEAQWRTVPAGMVVFLLAFALTQICLALLLLFRTERRLILIGLALFAITLLPALPLYQHFFPYYLFLPLAGFALIIGTTLDWAYRRLRAWRPLVANVAGVSLLSCLVSICSISVANDRRDNWLLGESSRLTWNAVSDLKAMYPELDPGATIYVLISDN